MLVSDDLNHPADLPPWKEPTVVGLVGLIVSLEALKDRNFMQILINRKVLTVRMGVWMKNNYREFETKGFLSFITA